MSETMRNEELVERAIAAVRQEAEGLDNAKMDAALERVRERLGVAPEITGAVLGCADMQRLLPAFLAGTLSHERELLVADHTRSCITCRRALKALQEDAPGATDAPVVASKVRRMPTWAWAAAATVALLLGLQLLVLKQTWLGIGGSTAMLRVIAGNVYGVGGQQAQAFGAGADIPYGQQVVTPRGQTAMVRLADGSTVELRERTRFNVVRRRGGTSLHLEGGNVIVEAAKQAPGRHLWVNTGDCEVAVVGTVFAVDAGTRGSRVSVYEGTVHVAQLGRPERVLKPGSQATTSARVRPVSLEDEVSWSTRREQHLALLAGAALLSKELAAMPPAEKRYESPYLDRLPATTVLYAAMPNLSNNLSQALDRVRERLASDPQLAQMVGGSEDVARLGTFLGHISNLGTELGEEIAVAGWLGPDQKFVGPVAVAPVADPAGFRAHLTAALPDLKKDLGGDHVFLVSDPSAATSAEGLHVWVSDELGAVVIACGGNSLAGIAAALNNGAMPFRDSAFHETIASRYATGVDGILAVDLKTMIAAHGDKEDADKLSKLGLDGVQHLLVEQWADGDVQRREAVISFDGARHGVASWLSAPGPMGALTFFSPDSTAVAAFVTKAPSLLLADVLASFSADERAQFDADHQKFVAEHGWDPIEDLAAPLGGEVALGIDGPVVPTPAWKLVVEVYDPRRLQVGIERLVADVDGQLRKNGEGSLALVAEGDGWIVRRTRADGTSNEGHYRYQDGYLVASATAGLVDKALQTRATDSSLIQSPRLRNLLPPDRQVNLSALWYQDLSGVIGPIAGVVQGMAGQAVPEGQQEAPAELQALTKMLGESAKAGPTVVFAYGEEDAIRISSSSPRNPLGLLDLLLSHGGSLGPAKAVGGKTAHVS
jgi:ferric-dicitrate binding protein FerR (iron transport regulator)